MGERKNLEKRVEGRVAANRRRQHVDRSGMPARWIQRNGEGRGLVIAGDPFALGAIAEAAESALAEQSGAETIEIVVSPFIGDAEGMYGFGVTLDREQREQFNL